MRTIGDVGGFDGRQRGTLGQFPRVRLGALDAKLRRDIVLVDGIGKLALLRAAAFGGPD